MTGTPDKGATSDKVNEAQLLCMCFVVVFRIATVFLTLAFLQDTVGTSAHTKGRASLERESSFSNGVHSHKVQHHHAAMLFNLLSLFLFSL